MATAQFAADGAPSSRSLAPRHNASCAALAVLWALAFLPGSSERLGQRHGKSACKARACGINGMCSSLAKIGNIMHPHSAFCAAGYMADSGTEQSACLAPMEAMAIIRESHITRDRGFPRETPQVSPMLGSMDDALNRAQCVHAAVHRCPRCKDAAVKVRCFYALAGTARLFVCPGT